jgi:glutamate--cysteine ligase
MSNPGDADATPLTSVRQMAEYLALGCKPPEAWRIGTEHEKFGFRQDDFATPPYLPADGQPGAIRDLLRGLARTGGTPILDGDNIIGLKQDSASVSLEPAGQLELSGAPLATLHETRRELAAHLQLVRAVAEPLRMGFAPLGFHPLASRAVMPWMPKGRYAIMRRYMPLVGSLGLDMMTRTCTVQVNLDFGSESDMRRKLRVSLLLQPLATALFANSPFTEGRPNGFQSYRAHVWTDTDNQRSGIPPVMLEDGFGFERYAQWLIEEVPMYFIYRDGRYIDVAGQSFRDFIAGKLPGLPGEIPTISDWSDHLTTVFPEIRIKKYLEMRGADGGPWRNLCALPAFWTGLLYDEDALRAAEDLVKEWSAEEREQLRADVPRFGLETQFRGRKLQEIAIAAVQLAKAGLKRRAHLNSEGDDESLFLQPVIEVAESGKTRADTLLDEYAARWRGLVDPVYVDDAY